MIREAIILAGGLGTRLRDVLPDLPKCMAPVSGRPFISYVIDYLRMQGVERIIISLGYKADAVQDYLQLAYPTLPYTPEIEQEPLGTGGAIQLALREAGTENVLMANGDTLFRVQVKQLFALHQENNAECSLALKPMTDFDRYGAVELNKQGQIISFREKQFFESGLINGGLYLLNKEKFLQRALPQQFSFENDYLQKFYQERQFYGCVQDGYFIDIGIPADYQKAQEDLQPQVLDLTKVSKDWTLFLDRDGVINDERFGEYVLHWGEFIFSKGVLDMFRKLSDTFHRIIIISNQRGVGKGLMTEADLQSIHLEMQREVGIVGGKIDRIYYCTEKEDTCYFRKPNPGMAFQASSDFPDIDMGKSIMVGNKPSDMRFGRSAGMFTVFVTTTNPNQDFPHPDIDLIFPSLYDFARAL
jgi:D-glycero-alpha-D-manno-heptose 1-phosphate guanylyltransferase